MTQPKTHRTRSGRILTDEEIDALSAEVAETDDDVEALKTRRRGRLAMGSGPADVVPVRIDPELRRRSKPAPKPSTPPPARSSVRRSAGSSKSPDRTELRSIARASRRPEAFVPVRSSRGKALTWGFGPQEYASVHAGSLRDAEVVGSNPTVPTRETPGQGRPSGRPAGFGNAFPSCVTNRVALMASDPFFRLIQRGMLTYHEANHGQAARRARCQAPSRGWTSRNHRFSADPRSNRGSPRRSPASSSSRGHGPQRS